MPSTNSDIALNADDAAEVIISQVDNYSFSGNLNLSAVKGSGGQSPKTHIVEGGEPTLSITTTDTTILAANSNLFLVKGYAATAAASVFPSNILASGAGINSGSVHTGISVPRVFAYPTSISGTGTEAIQINVDMKLYGTARRAFPHTAITSAAQTVEVFSEQHEMSDIYLKGVLLSEVVSFTYTPAINVVRDDFGGFPLVFNSISQDATVEIVVQDIAKAEAEISANSTLSGGGIIIYLAKRVAEAQIATGTNHAKITGLDGLVHTEQITYSQGAKGTGTIRVNLGNSNNANSGALVTYATGVAIP